MSRHCCVQGCSNGDYRLNMWFKQVCELHPHQMMHGHDTCDYKPPFELFTFPTQKKNSEKRLLWVKLINRACGNKKTTNSFWKPGSQSRVCSVHFVDSKPTEEHPNPTMHIGYPDYEKRVRTLLGTRRKIEKISLPPPKKKNKLPNTEEGYLSNIDIPEVDEVAIDHGAERSPQVENHIDKIYAVLWFAYMIKMLCSCLSSIVSPFINDYTYKAKASKIIIDKLLKENKSLRYQLKIYKSKLSKCDCEKRVDEKLLKSDENVKFYSGIETKEIFHKLYNFISPYVIRKWRGAKQSSSKVCRKNPRKESNSNMKLSGREEFLMMLMKLRLGLLNQDLADRFNASPMLVSQIFSTWVRAAARFLKAFIYVPDMGTINVCRPKKFTNCKKLHSIIDATEIFIQTPKSLDNQRMTWSSYKHHNTVKVLVANAPNSHIMFISQAYAGSISDKELVKQSGYLDFVEPYTDIMVDKGFNINEECAARRINILVPPGKCGKSQMMPHDVSKTQNIAKLRILVEQVIRRFKTFRLISQEVPINLLSHIDDIIVICAALCNLKTPIIK